MKKIILLFITISFFTLISCAESAGGGGGESDAAPSKPEIEILEDGNSIINGLENYNIGSQLVGTSKDVVFTLKNTGTADLVFTNDPVITLTGTCFSLKTDAASRTVKAGESEDFCLCFNPTDSISYTADIVIENNDSDEYNFNFTVIGTGNALPSPEIGVKIGSDEYTSGNDYTFSNVIADGNDGLTSDEVTFTIENTGTADLNITDISITGADKDDFDLAADFSNPVSPSGNMNISLKFDPLETGTKNAVLEIRSNDIDEATYTVNLAGEAGSVPAPEINIKQGSNSLASGTGSYAFEDVVADGNDGLKSSQIIFTIENVGNKGLEISNIEINGTNADCFDLTNNISSPIAGSDSEDIIIVFDPLSVGSKTAVLEIRSNDTDEATYTVNLTGEGLAIPVSEINVKQGSTSLASGTASYAFGTIKADGNGGITGSQIAFTIENTGNKELVISNIEITGTNADNFDLTANISSPIAGSDSEEIIIVFDPLSVGSKTSVLNIESNDADEGTYTINLTGYGKPATEKNVYLSGYRENSSEDSLAMFWENGVDQNTFGSITNPSNAYSIFVSGSDVYISGEIENDSGKSIATWWKNGGKKPDLSDGLNNAEARDIFVSGSDVYIVGYAEDSSGNSSAKLWKNKNNQNLVVTGDSSAKSVFVDGSDVYVAGSDEGYGVLWKNGTKEYTLTSGSSWSNANSVFVDSGDVYICGDISDSSGNTAASWWINGVKQNDLADGVEWSTANSICVSDGNVYIAGCENTNSGTRTLLKWWKNGDMQPNLTDGSQNSEANSIFVVDDEIFIAGYEESSSEVGIAKLWINGIDQNIYGDSTDSQVYDIFVTD